MNFFFDIYDWVMVAQLLSTSIAVVLVFRHLRFTLKAILRGISHVAIVFAIGTLLNYGLFELAENLPILRGINFPLSWLVVIILYIAFFSNIAPANKIIMGATLYVSFVTMTELGHYSAMLFGQMGMSQAVMVSCYVMENVFILAFAVFMKRYTLSKYTDIPAISAILILINSVVMAGVIFINTRFMMTGVTSTYELYCVILLAEYILVITGYLMIWFHCKVRHEITELEVTNRLLESDRSAIMISEKAIEDMRCIKHDIKNQYQVMQMLLNDGRYEELKKYFESMNLSDINSIGPKFIDCGSELLNSIINMEMIKASSNGVELTVKINVADEIKIDQSDLCRVIVNLLDNAIEAVVRHNAYNVPVDCRIGKTSDYLYICVRNGLGNLEDNRKALELVTSKKDSSAHGIGHRIVGKLVNKYNGNIKYTIEDNEFVAEAMLENREVSES